MVLGGLLGLLLSTAGCGAVESGSGEGPVYGSSGSASSAWPMNTMVDLVSYADHIAVVTVRSETALGLGEDELKYDEGMIGREATLDIERTLWSRPSGPAVPDSVTLITSGWILHEGERAPVEFGDGVRLEVGQRYVVALAQVADQETGKREWASYEHLPLEGDTIGAMPEEAWSEIWEAQQGHTLDEYAAALADVEPNATAVKYAELDPEQRWMAVDGASMIEFAFLTGDTRYAAFWPDDSVPGVEDDFGVVRTGAAGQSIQYEPGELDIAARKVEELPPVAGGIQPALYETMAAPTAPVLVWDFPDGTMWVVLRNRSDAELIAENMIVSEWEGSPHVELQPPLESGDPTDPAQQEWHRLFDAGCRFIRADEADQPDVADGGGIHIARLTTEYGVVVECTGDLADADAIDARAQQLAYTLSPLD